MKGRGRGTGREKWRKTNGERAEERRGERRERESRKRDEGREVEVSAYFLVLFHFCDHLLLLLPSSLFF